MICGPYPWSMVSPLDQGLGTIVCLLDHGPGSLLDQVYSGLSIWYRVSGVLVIFFGIFKSLIVLLFGIKYGIY